MPSTKVNNYTVIKNFDVQNSLNKVEKEIFKLLLDKIRGDKIANSYYVVNTDEPYAKNILEEIYEGEVAKLDIMDLAIQALKDAKSNFNVTHTCYKNRKYNRTVVECHPLLGDVAFNMKYDFMHLFSTYKEDRHYECSIYLANTYTNLEDMTLQLEFEYNIKEID